METRRKHTIYVSSMIALVISSAAFLIAGCGGKSPQISISNPTPSILLISPTAVAVGSSSQITITGTGFLASSMVTFNGATHSASLVNSGQLNLSLSAADLSSIGTFAIVVSNVSPGGGPSAPVPLNVWNGVSDMAGGVSVLYPASLSSVTSTSASFDLASSPNGVAIGGAIPDFGSNESSSGYDVNVYYAPYSVTGNFDVNSYISTTYPGRIVGTIAPITVGGQQGSSVTFLQEEGGGHPDVIIYHNGFVYEIRYDSTANVAGFSDTSGINAFNQVIQNFSFTR